MASSISNNSVLQSAMNGEPLTVYADGSYLKDASGNIVGTLNDDGTYQLLTEFTPQQLSEGQDALLQSFEKEVAASETQNVVAPPVSAPEQTSLLKSSLFETASTNRNPVTENIYQKTNKATSLLKPGISHTTKSKTNVSPKTVPVKSDVKKEVVKDFKFEAVKKPSPARFKSGTTGVNYTSSQVKTEPSTPKSNVSSSKTNVSVAINTPVSKKEPIDSITMGAPAPSPLGSSSNPIRIIQQGNSYTSTQQLTQEQLAQIMQVVQQQQALKEAQEAGGSKVIYNPQTQTKIVYKVVNPGPVVSKSSGAVASLITPRPRKRGRPKTSEDDEVNGPELTPKKKKVPTATLR